MSMLGKIGTGIAKIGGGLLTGGVGGAIGALGGLLGGGGNIQPPPKPSFGGNGGFNMPFQVNGPGGLPLPGYNPGGTVTPQGGQCPRGYHLNKHALAASKRHGAVAARSICVRNRSMNPMNPRAVTRSLKRIKRANKIVRRLHAFSPIRHSSSKALVRRK